MICAYCSKPIEENEAYCKAGPNNSVFCSKKCVYQAFQGFYTEEELDKAMDIKVQLFPHNDN